MLYKMSEKLCLQWNDFKDNVRNAFGSLREDNNFADVTLACEDGQQVEAHKVILATSSPFFKKLLERNKHPHPLIYMRGTRSSNLLAILDFLYRGEANVFQDDLDSFLAIAEELQLEGLMGNSEERFGDSNKEEKDISQNMAPNLNNETVKQRNPSNLQSYAKQGRNQELALPVNSSLALPGNFSVDFVALEERVKSMMEKSYNNLGNGRGFAYLCKVCGKEGRDHHIQNHIEANHLEGVVIPCDICEKTFRCRDIFRKHAKKTQTSKFILRLFLSGTRN